MKTRLGIAVAVAGVAALTMTVLPGAAAGKKPAPTPWPCTVTLDDREGDVIRSDSRGAYINGLGGVTCIVLGNDPAAGHYGWLEMGFSDNATRYLLYIGQATDADGRPGYSGFSSRGTFQVKGLLGTSDYPGVIDIRPFRAQTEIGLFNGDSNWSGAYASTGASSVFVFPHSDGCTWDVWFDTTAGPFVSPVGSGDSTPTRYDPRVMEWVQTQGSRRTIRGYFPMPFKAHVTVTSGKLGCPAA